MTLLAALLLAVLPEAQPFNLDVQVTPEEVTLGEHMTVRISVEHDLRDVYGLQGFDPAPLAVPQGAPAPAQKREELPGGHARTVFELVLVDYGTLEPRLPDLTLAVNGPDGARQLSVRGRPLKLRSLVEEEGQGAPDRAHHGPKPPVPVMVRSYLWVAVLLAIAAVVAAIVLWRRRRARAAAPVLAIPLRYDELALEQLESLRVQTPWQRGEGRAAIFRLSEIVRGYLGERLSFNALDLTSEEFLQALRERRLMGIDLAELTEEVRWEDLVKFAKLEPSGEECLRGISRAESMIRHTRLHTAVAA